MSDQASTVILGTKLQRPRIAPNTVIRPRLVRAFEEAATASVLLVSAPAGYGKTTAVNLWLEEETSPCAWYSVDEHDSNLRQFVDYMVAAVRAVYPESLHEVSAVQAGPSDLGPDILAGLFLKGLEDLGGPLTFVIDDYHVIHDLDVRAFMARLVRRLPHNIQLTLVSRADPEIGLTLLRGRGLLHEIRTDTIRFTAGEAAELLYWLTGEAIEEKVVDVLVQCTEGWPFALQLAGMAMRSREDPLAFAERFAASRHRTVMDYLASEVLKTLPEPEHALLLRCAILDRFCAPLCDILAEGTSLQGQGPQLVEKAWKRNWFLVALDDDGEWYRYHHLFSELLRNRLGRLESEDTISQLHRRASVWCEQNNLLEEAVTYAVRAGDVERAAELVENNIQTALDQSNWRLLERWLNMLPDEATKRPALVVAQAFIAHFSYRHAAIDALLDEADAALTSNLANYSASQISQIQSNVHQLRASFFKSGDPAQHLYHAERALDLMGSDAGFCRGQTELYYAFALHQLGRTKEALAYLTNLSRRHHGTVDARHVRHMVGTLGIHYTEADMASLESQAVEIANATLSEGRAIADGWVRFAHAYSNYQRNELDQAAQRFSQALEYRYEVPIRPAIDCFAGLALTQQAQGFPEHADQTVLALRSFVRELSLVGASSLCEALDLRLSILRNQQGPGEILWRAPASFVSLPEDQLAADPMILPVFVAIQVNLAGGSGEALTLAWQLIQRCRKHASRTNARRQKIELGVLEAQYHILMGDTEAALRVLRQSVLLAQSGGAVRLIVDNAYGLSAHLQQLREEGLAPRYLAQICETIERQGLSTSSLGGTSGQRSVALVHSRLPDTVPDLTSRESEVLELLFRGFTNKEIATELAISTNTVKKHTVNIYQKLNVPNRQRAVRAAVELGLILQER